MNKYYEKSFFAYLVLAVAICAIAVLYYGRIDYTADLFFDWDLWSYRHISAVAPSIGGDVDQPFAFRLLGPYLAGVLAGTEDWGFYSFTLIASFVFVVSFYVFLVYMGIKPSIALFTVAVFILNKYFFGYTVWNYFHINDMLSFTYLAIMIWAVVARKWGIFGLVLVIGVFTRETALIMVPVTGVFLLETGTIGREWRRAAAAILPGVICFIAIRLIIKHAEGDGLFEAFLNNYSKLLEPEVWYRLLINSFAPVSLLPLVFFEETKRFFRNHKYLLVFIVLVFLTTLFGLNNERLMGPSSLAYYLLIATIVQNRFGANKWMLCLVLGFAMLNSTHHNIGAFTLESRNMTILLSVTSIFAVTLGAVAYRAMAINRFSTRLS